MNGVKVFGLVTLSIPLFVIVTRYYFSSSPQPKDKQKKKSEQEEEEVIVGGINVSWSELVPNLLGEIASRLCLTDQARFLVVCKNWLAAAHPIINTLPWHGCIIPGSSEFQIFDPLSSTPNHLASLHNISWSNLGIPSPSTVHITSVQHNWLFLCIKKPLWFYWTRRYSLLFSPFTKKVITLPRFDYPRRLKFTSTFSTQPDSPDCVYCMIDTYYTDKISVMTYRNGDKEWTAREFNKVPDFRSCHSTPLILHGILYMVSCFGQVASYNILNGEFNFDCLFLDELLVRNAYSNRKRKVFVLNEEPLILYYDPDAKKDVTLPGKQCIKRYDRSRKVWIPVSTLVDYALFFSEKVFGVSLINTKDRRNNGVLSNKIYHFVNGGCHVYSLEDGNLVHFKSINSNLLEDGGGELPEYKYNYGIPDTLGVSAYWLKPPCVRSSLDNQEEKNCRTKARSGKTLEAHSRQALEADSCQVVEAAYNFSSLSKHPSYTCVMSFSYIRKSNLYVPSTFVKQVNTAAGAIKVKLQCWGKEWDAVLSTYGMIHNGWSTFAKENSLQIGDACVLELINREDALIRVTIFKCTN